MLWWLLTLDPQPFQNHTHPRRVLSREWGDGGAAAAAALNDDRRYVKAMWAFALEENGDYARAAAVAREVLAEDPTGGWIGVGGFVGVLVVVDRHRR